MSITRKKMAGTPCSEFYGLFEDGFPTEEKFGEICNADPHCFMDYHLLTDEQKAEIKNSSVHAYDAKNKRWLPQLKE